MAVLEVVINSKIYQIGCEEDEKEYIKSIVANLNERINKLKQQNPSFFAKLNEEKLFLYQLLLMCGEINDLKKQKKQTKAINDKNDNSFNEKEINRINNTINNIKKSLLQLDNLVK